MLLEAAVTSVAGAAAVQEIIRSRRIIQIHPLMRGPAHYGAIARPAHCVQRAYRGRVAYRILRIGPKPHTVPSRLLACLLEAASLSST